MYCRKCSSAGTPCTHIFCFLSAITMLLDLRPPSAFCSAHMNPLLMNNNNNDKIRTHLKLSARSFSPYDRPIHKRVRKENMLPVCLQCGKKVGYLGFTCKCNNLFCAVHRHAEAHRCSYNFAQEGRERLTQENQQITASKLERI